VRRRSAVVYTECMPKVTPGITGREKAYEHLREHVLTDPRMQGQFLNEQDLAARIGVSRTPVREALLLLVADGLIELIPQRGALIPAVSGRQMADLLELRRILERHAAEVAIARKAVPFTEMAAVLHQQRELQTQDRRPKEFIDLDRQFHQLLIDAADNNLISETYAKLSVRQVLIGVEALFRSVDRQSQVCGEHQEILDALERGDIASAWSAIDKHLEITLKVLLGG
jgi:DNA-binding GntR family transcriptional regulator